jgi:hypothetical protein
MTPRLATRNPVHALLAPSPTSWLSRPLSRVDRRPHDHAERSPYTALRGSLGVPKSP